MTKISNLLLCLLSTRDESFKEHNNSGRRISQKEKAFQFLIKNDIAVTSRSLAKHLGFERTNCTRIIRDLIDEKRVYVAHEARCPETGKIVNHYRVVPTLEQGKLFK